MKKHLLIFTVFLFVCLYNSHSQQQWKFHLAFEDATGAKDTIWFIWDTTASFYNVDTLLGEGNPHMDYTKFNVYTFIWDTENDYDTSKVVANPYNYSFESELRAINFVLPITINWDSALFHADWLPSEPVGWVNYARIANNYFFLYGNTDFDHNFDMTLENNVIEPYPGNDDPWAWEDWVHFPMGIMLMQDPTLDLNKNIVEKVYLIFPNPFTTTTTLQFNLNTTDADAVEIKIFDQVGKEVQHIPVKSAVEGMNTVEVNMQGLPSGIYYYSLFINGKQADTKKMVVTR